jgi:hypothetical protein
VIAGGCRGLVCCEVCFAVRCVHLRIRTSSDLLCKELIPWLCGLELHCVSSELVTLFLSAVLPSSKGISEGLLLVKLLHCPL